MRPLWFAGMGVRLPRSGRAGVASIADADTEMAPRLDSLANADNYTSWIFGLVEPHLGDEVLEVGAGHGTFTEILRARGTRVVATDVADRCADLLRARFAGDAGVSVVQGGTEAVAGMPPFDCAVLINVLEHIKDDDGALLDLAAALKPGGRVILWVPAFQLLYCDFDRKVGHYRRYRKGALRAQLTNAGYDVTDIRYVNSAGALAWLVLGRLMGQAPAGGQDRVQFYDSYFVPVLRRLEGRRGVPFGQSVFAVATWPGYR
jgi:SAM-dependent methyltransferase